MLKSFTDLDYLKFLGAFYKTENLSRLGQDEMIFNIMENNIKPYIDEKIIRETISERATKISKERTPPINLPKLVYKRLAKIYSESPVRIALNDNQSDKELIEIYEDQAHLNYTLSQVNLMLCAQRRQAIDVQEANGTPYLRIFPANQFLVWHPFGTSLTPEVMMILMGVKNKIVKDSNGVSTSKEVQILAIYNDKQFTIIDEDGDVQSDEMEALKYPNVFEHNIGRLPFVYVNQSVFQLMPDANIDDVEVCLMMNCLIGDLNYALKYQAHSLLYTINIDTGKIDMNPDSMVNFQSNAENGDKVEVGAIKPDIDIEGTLKSLASQLRLFLESKGLKPSDNASVSSNDAASGIHETIRNATLTEERKDYTLLFSKVEADLFDLISIRHNKWHKLNKLKFDFAEKSFSKDFKVKVHFAEQKIATSRKEKSSIYSIEVEAGLSSRETAIRDIHPEWTDTQITTELEKIQKERKEFASIDASVKMNENNRKLANKAKAEGAMNDNSTAQDENPNKS